MPEARQSLDEAVTVAGADLEEVVARFETAWQSGQAPAIDDYLPLGDTSRRAALAELVRRDLACRLKGGQAARVEEYLLRYPELQADRQAVLKLITTEFELRRHREPDLPSAEFLQRFPGYVAEMNTLAAFERPAPATMVPATVTSPGRPARASGAPETQSDGDRDPFATRLSDKTPPQPDAIADSKYPTIPGYEVLQELGRGGMGVVYLARQLGLNRVVALKMILSGEMASRAEVERFRAEAEALARLQHPNIVAIHDVGEYQGRPFFSLEFMEGGSLADRIKGTPQESAQAVRWVEVLARAMHAAHEAGIVHRDLKPANVLIATDGSLKVTDFGLAKKLDEGGGTRSGHVMGTPSYMPPEQAEGRTRDVGPAADTYALGAVLYELLTGRPPFKAPTAMETLLQVLREEPVPPRRFQPRVPIDVETICLKCLEKEPRRRYASALQLAEDMQRYQSGEPVQARPLNRFGRAVKWMRRRPAAATLLAVLVAAALGLAGLLVWHDVDSQFKVKAATAAEKQANAQRRLAELDTELARGQTALAAGRFQDARQIFDSALARMDTDETHGERRAEADAGLAEATRGLSEARRRADELARRAAQEQSDRIDLNTFRKRRDDALFHSALLTGADLSVHLKATTTAARDALRVFKLSAAGAASIELRPSFTDKEKREVTEKCYELLLVLADAVTRQEMPDYFEALDLVERADSLGFDRHPTRTFHERRAHYLQIVAGTRAALPDVIAADRLPSTALDHFLLGENLHRQGQLSDAANEFQKALLIQSDHFWAQYFLAVCHIRQGGHAGEARIGLTACLTVHDDFVWAYLLRGLADLQLRDLAAAEDDFKKAEELPAIRQDAEAQYTLRVNRAELWNRQGRSADALNELLKADELKPNQYQTFLNLAAVHQKLNDADAAAESFRRAISFAEQLHARGELEPSAVALVYGHRALFRRFHAQTEDGLADLDAALRWWPEYADAHAQRGEVMLERKQYQQALDAFNRYLQHGGRPTARLFHARGQAHFALKLPGEAIADYSESLRPDLRKGFRNDEELAQVHTARGRAFLLSKAARPARNDFDAAIRLNPKSGDAYAGRAYASAQLHEYDKAMQDVDRALEPGPLTADRLGIVAAVCAQVVVAMDADPALADQQRLQRRDYYQRRCVVLLRQALDALPSDDERARYWREAIARDPYLLHLRDAPGFPALQAKQGQQ
jgi:tetratricopeptide (TPR) repeat protein/predicted Ser/Thr protein kinase